ncbi:hypothetical protein [Streptomyces sp. PD-S100-1]
MTAVAAYVALVIITTALLCGHQGENLPPIPATLRRLMADRHHPTD